MTSLSVLNVIIKGPNDRGGGAARAGLLLGKYLQNHINVDTVLMDGEYNEQLCEDIGLEEWFTVPSYSFLRDISKQIVDFEQNFANVLVGTRLTPPKALSTYDLVHIHNPVPLAGMVCAALSCRIAGVPYCVTAHAIGNVSEMPEGMGLSTFQTTVFEHAFVKPYRWVLSNATHLIALSKKNKKQLQKLTRTPSVNVIPNGVELNPPRKQVTERIDKTAGVSPESLLVLFVGDIHPGKGVLDLLSAYRSLGCNPSLRLVGQEQSEETVEEICQTEGDVEYLGYVSRDTLDKLYQRADIFALPTHYDVYPLVNLEAMASRTPVVSTEVGGIPDQVTPETGILVPPKNPEIFSKALSTLLTDDNRRERMEGNAYKRAKNLFSWDQIARQTCNTYVKNIA